MINVGKYVKKNKYKEEIKVAILDSGERVIIMSS